MSEFQYVGFRAAEKPVSDKDLEYTQQQSSRAEITPWTFDSADRERSEFLAKNSFPDDYFFIPAPLSEERSTASPGPKSSYSTKGRISHSLSPPRRNGA